MFACPRSTEAFPSLTAGYFPRFGGVCLGTFLLLLATPLAMAQDTPSASPPTPDALKCSALAQLKLEDAPGGPAIVSSAHLVEVPSTGLDQWIVIPSGYGSVAARIPTRIHAYCDVTGYVAPQNKFELKLPLPGDWNQKFFFTACGGFCGYLDGRRCNLGLARSYATVTGDGGHESVMGFDGVWAANAPELLEDFGWRSNHVVTLISKFIVTRYYGTPMKHSYVVGDSKGGQAVLMEAQRFPEDFDGLMPSAPVYDYTGRNTIAAAWFAQGITDGHGGSVITAETSRVVHNSVLEHCGAQSGVEEGLVTDPPSCQWKPEMIACAPGTQSRDCLNQKEVSAINRLMSPATNSKGEVLWAYPYIPGTETQWGPGITLGRSVPDFLRAPPTWTFLGST